jgi:hypothetical protein
MKQKSIQLEESSFVFKITFYLIFELLTKQITVISKERQRKDVHININSQIRHKL